MASPFTGISQLLHKELVNDYSYSVGGIPGINDSQYDFTMCSNSPWGVLVEMQRLLDL